MTQEAEPKRTRAIVVAVQRPSVSDPEFEASLEELRALREQDGVNAILAVSRNTRGAGQRLPRSGCWNRLLGVAVKAELTKPRFDATVGIHPTGAEEFVTLREKTAAGYPKGTT